MGKNYDLAVFMGRFQPAHSEHIRCIREALEVSEKVLIILGSCNRSRGTRHPFSPEERCEMLNAVVRDNGWEDRVELDIINDHPGDDSGWVEDVQSCVRLVTEVWNSTRGGAPVKIALTGADRDNSTYYLRKFPQWDFIGPKQGYMPINSTAIRKELFEKNFIPSEVPTCVVPILQRIMMEAPWANLKRKYAADKKYRKDWGPGPHVCVDAVVIQSGHILLVERGGEIGYGELALPGGHLELDETLDRAVLRELFEETGLFSDIPNDEERRQQVWTGYAGREMFDEVHRSTRARVLTMAFMFKLRDAPELPKVLGADDAKRAFWMPLAELDHNPDKMFDDHWFIIDRMRSYIRR